MGRYCTNKDVDKVVRGLLREGWTVREGKRHVILRAPWGAVVTVSRSPSDVFAYKNVMGDIKRASIRQSA